MSYRLKLELDGLPLMVNAAGASRHWRITQKDRAHWKTLVVAKIPFYAKPAKPLKKARLTLIRFSSSEPDFDGITSGFKALVDALVLAGVLEDDKYSNTGVWNCHWEVAPPKKGRVVVLVEESI